MGPQLGLNRGDSLDRSEMRDQGSAWFENGPYGFDEPDHLMADAANENRIGRGKARERRGRRTPDGNNAIGRMIGEVGDELLEVSRILLDGNHLAGTDKPCGLDGHAS